MIHKSNLINVELAKDYNLNAKTISKWKHRNFIIDKSTRLDSIKITLRPLEKDLNKFLIYYDLNRKDDSLRKELKVRTFFEQYKVGFEANLKY
jgi:hypothetical protein